MNDYLPIDISKSPKAKLKTISKDFLVEEIPQEGTPLKIGKEYLFDKKSQGDFFVFALEKEEIDTFMAVRRIIEKLKIPEGKITTAGMKDKKAITIQRASAHKMNKERFENLKIANIKIKPLYYGEKVYLGALTGNRFTITLRNIDYDEEKTQKYIEDIKNSLNGYFPNYYGEQRFGGTRPITHVVGKYLVMGDIKSAVIEYIAYTDKIETKLDKNRKNAFSNLEKAKNKFPKSCVYELDMISHLIENPNDFLGAIKQIPQSLRKMFVSAYQSYIFNRALFELLANKNVKKTIKIPVPGYLFSSRIFSDDSEDMVEKILKKEKIEPSRFKLQNMSELSSEGTKRSAFAKFYDFKILNVTKDDLNKGKTKATITFSLDKGTYATVFLRQFFNLV